jgi:soluble lytic murein transglycosylase
VKRKQKTKQTRTLIIVLVFVIVICAATVISFAVARAAKKAAYPLRYEQEITAQADKYGLTKSLVLSVMRTESSFRPTVVSAAGAIGLMQIMPETGKWIAGKIGMQDFDVVKLNDPETNIALGCWYLGYLMDLFDGDINAVLAGYNAGQNRVRGWLGNPAYTGANGRLAVIPDPEAKNYVEKVLYAQKIYRELYEMD